MTNNIIFKKITHFGLVTLVFIYIIFEEIFWETIAKPVYTYIHSLKLLQKLEVKVHTLPPWLLLIAFLVLFINVELMGLIAGAMIIQGKIILATSLYISKIPITAFAFWLFRVSKDKLMTFGWFKTAYNYTMRKIDQIKNSEIYQTIKAKVAKIKISIKAWKEKYLPKGELKAKIQKIYARIKKIFKGT